MFCNHYKGKKKGPRWDLNFDLADQSPWLSNQRWSVLKAAVATLTEDRNCPCRSLCQIHVTVVSKIISESLTSTKSLLIWLK